MRYEKTIGKFRLPGIRDVRLSLNLFESVQLRSVHRAMGLLVAGLPGSNVKGCTHRRIARTHLMDVIRHRTHAFEKRRCTRAAASCGPEPLVKRLGIPRSRSSAPFLERAPRNFLSSIVLLLKRLFGT